MTSPISALGFNPYAAAATGVASPTAPTAGTEATTSTQSMLDPQAFLQLLVAQLKYQDPTQPMDTSQFMNQTATLSQVQTMNTMSDTLTSLVQMQQMQSGTAMLGKSVTYNDPAGMSHTGVVNGVSATAGRVTVQVGAQSVDLTSITAIHNASV